MGKLSTNRNVDGVVVCLPQLKYANRCLDGRFNRIVCDFNEVVRRRVLGLVDVGGGNIEHVRAVIFRTRNRHDTYTIRAFVSGAVYGNQFSGCLYNHSRADPAYPPKVAR